MECVFVKNQLILIGELWEGYYGSPIHSVDVHTGEVKKLRSLPLVLYGMAVVSVNNDIFICGGRNKPSEFDLLIRSVHR